MSFYRPLYIINDNNNNQQQQCNNNKNVFEHHDVPSLEFATAILENF